MCLKQPPTCPQYKKCSSYHASRSFFTQHDPPQCPKTVLSQNCQHRHKTKKTNGTEPSQTSCTGAFQSDLDPRLPALQGTEFVNHLQTIFQNPEHVHPTVQHLQHRSLKRQCPESDTELCLSAQIFMPSPAVPGSPQPGAEAFQWNGRLDQKVRSFSNIRKAFRSGSSTSCYS